MSFNEWKAAGYGVRKGEKCSGFDMLGVPQFTALQVRKINPAWNNKFRR